ncbi:50S ribosomal protein L29 [Candidatus Shapirobacteria bacterium]|jgi:ribosomal protein L29|nr:50S ribosomal protein L29 [Candidatus Shapirobacteria bacterium]
MKKTDKMSYRQKSSQELSVALADLQKKLVETRLKHLTGNQKDTSVIRKIKYEIAYVSTLITENGK